MKLDKSLFKKVYIDFDKIMIVSGYDFINKKYIIRRYNRKNQVYLFNEYMELRDKDKEKLVDAEEAIKALEEKIQKLQEVLGFYEKFASKCKPFEARNTVRRLVDTRKYIDILNSTYTKSKGKDKPMYDRELKKALKGERRVLKVLYGKLSPEDYDNFLKCIEKYPDFDVYNIKKKIERYQNLKTQLEEIKKIEIEL